LNGEVRCLLCGCREFECQCFALESSGTLGLDR
jgi:hypothetical protein